MYFAYLRMSSGKKFLGFFYFSSTGLHLEQPFYSRKEGKSGLNFRECRNSPTGLVGLVVFITPSKLYLG